MGGNYYMREERREKRDVIPSEGRAAAEVEGSAVVEFREKQIPPLPLAARGVGRDDGIRSLFAVRGSPFAFSVSHP
jgi:hypothetical protein